tara:strand:+ start:388 stop:858 length:471 start_codon:yes stop_codon:yes gene_type:complete
MGFKLSLILGFLLIASIGGGATYIKLLKAELQIAQGNQVILEGKVQEQNASIERHLEKQAQINMQLNSLEAEKNNAMREFNELRNKFARHDMNSLALAKPKLIEKRVNNGTHKVKMVLIELTNPNQFDKKLETKKEEVIKSEEKIEVPDAKASASG